MDFGCQKKLLGHEIIFFTRIFALFLKISHKILEVLLKTTASN